MYQEKVRPQVIMNGYIFSHGCPGCTLAQTAVQNSTISIGGLVVKSNVAIVGPRVRFPADAFFFFLFRFFVFLFFGPVISLFPAGAVI